MAAIALTSPGTNPRGPVRLVSKGRGECHTRFPAIPARTATACNDLRPASTRRFYVFFLEHDNRRVHLAGVTEGMMINNPTATWVKNTVVPIYNSGSGDQANPSSVEITPGTFLTVGYNAKPKSASPTGGTLWVIESHLADY